MIVVTINAWFTHAGKCSHRADLPTSTLNLVNMTTTLPKLTQTLNNGS